MNTISSEQLLFDFLKEQGIAYRLFEHQPVYTINDKPQVIAVDGVPSSESVPKPHFKTLFLKNKEGRFFLVSVLEDKRVDLNALSKDLECGRFSFGSTEELFALLRLIPGSVTPFGLLFDQEHTITYILDEDALNHPVINFHPMRNDKSVVLTIRDFMACMKKLNHEPILIKIMVK